MPPTIMIVDNKNEIATPEFAIEYFTALLYSICVGLFRYTKNVIRNIIVPHTVSIAANGFIISIILFRQM